MGCGMMDLRNPRLIWLKGWLFLLCGVLAGALLIREHPDLKTAALLAVCVWCFMRFYYFMFYVIEKYVDSQHRFAGIGAFLAYAVRSKGAK